MKEVKVSAAQVIRIIGRPEVIRLEDDNSECQREAKRLVGTVRCGGGRRVLRKKLQGGNY